MHRPFRFTPPSVLDVTVERPRLLSRVAGRWERRLTTLVAGPGFGKTTLLAAALTAPPPTPGTDVWLSCEPADESVEHLVGGLASAMGLSSSADLDQVVQEVWSRAPTAVCFVIDDVHEVPAGSPGAATIERLLAELPLNGHVVLASRDAVPVRTARLAAAADLVRITEDDLLLDDDELALLAETWEVSPDLLSTAGGWPALTVLTADAGRDLVLGYLWEEVLDRLGPDRTRLLALIAAVGGADDEIASAAAGEPIRVDDVVAGVPLVERAGGGAVSLHPLWTPALRGRLDRAEVARAACGAASVLRARGELGSAADLLAEGEAWDELVGMLRDAEAQVVGAVRPGELVRWCQLLPSDRREDPEVLLATGLARMAREPLDAVASIRRARDAFVAGGDVDGEAMALAHEGLIRWWTHDIAELLGLIGRVDELARGGSSVARAIGAVGQAAVAHLGGDSDAVRAHLDGIDADLLDGWHPVMHWLRSVAHRRDGDVVAARRELELATGSGTELMELELQGALPRTSWLAGDVDGACEGWLELRARYERLGDRYVEREVVVELARVLAWSGRADEARIQLADGRVLLATESFLSEVLTHLAEAAVLVADGDEAGAARVLEPGVLSSLGGPDAWYWRDRAAIALTYVLVPECRTAWTVEPLGACHLPGLALGQVLASVRDGDLTVLHGFDWPEPGVVRAHLPIRWVVELIAAAEAAGSPAPGSLVSAVGPGLRPILRDVAESHAVAEVAAAAARLASHLPAVPSAPVAIGVLGPLEVRHDGVLVDGPDVRRRRVRELLSSVVAQRQVRREALSEELWPEHLDGGRNLRVTLSYAQRVLQPDRPAPDPPYFLRSDGTWLRLEGGEHLEVDAWRLDALLDEAERADQAAEPGQALASYVEALPLWRGEPYQDAPDAGWVEAERTRLRGRFVSGALRASELLLARGDHEGARRAAERATVADPVSEPACRLVARACLAAGDRVGAQRAVEACRRALAELGLAPEPATLAADRYAGSGSPSTVISTRSG